MRAALIFVAVTFASLVAAGSATAQGYPTRPIRLIALSSPASGPDIVGRLPAQGFCAHLPDGIDSFPARGPSLGCGNLDQGTDRACEGEAGAAPLWFRRLGLAPAPVGRDIQEHFGWYSLVAPARTPPAILAKLNAEVVKTLKTSELRERLSNLGADPIGSTQKELAAYLPEQLEKMRKAVKDSGARSD
jgi:tripartite-type tricarboxylate transporter receptor subunit TctC